MPNAVQLVENGTWRVPPEQRPGGWQTWPVREPAPDPAGADVAATAAPPGPDPAVLPESPDGPDVAADVRAQGGPLPAPGWREFRGQTVRDWEAVFQAAGALQDGESLAVKVPLDADGTLFNQAIRSALLGRKDLGKYRWSVRTASPGVSVLSRIGVWAPAEVTTTKVTETVSLSRTEEVRVEVPAAPVPAAPTVKESLVVRPVPPDEPDTAICQRFVESGSARPIAEVEAKIVALAVKVAEADTESDDHSWERDHEALWVTCRELILRRRAMATAERLLEGWLAMDHEPSEAKTRFPEEWDADGLRRSIHEAIYEHLRKLDQADDKIRILRQELKARPKPA